MRYKSQRLTELVGGVVLRPYVPHGTKWIGEGEGEISIHYLCFCPFYIFLNLQ